MKIESFATKPRAARPGAVLLVLALILASGCSRHIEGHFEDTQLIVRVKTALVNDVEVGTEPIQVEASGGAVHLSGAVRTADLAERAVTLARAVDGVRDVQSTLVTTTAEPAMAETRRRRSGGRPRTGGAAEPEEPRQPLFGVGAALDLHAPTDDALDGRVTIRPAFLFRRGAGFGPTFGFGWFPADLAEPGVTVVPSGTLRVRPVMGGIGYTVIRGRTWITPSLVAGLSFNAVSTSDAPDAEVRAIGVDRSFAWRPSVRVGHFVAPRVSIDGEAGYLVTRPGVTFLGPDGVSRRSVTADSFQLRVSVVYWPF